MLTPLSVTEIQKMSPQEVSRLSKIKLRSLGPEAMKALSTAQLDAIRIEYIHSLLPAQIKALTPPQLDIIERHLTDTQLQAITPSHYQAWLKFRAQKKRDQAANRPTPLQIARWSVESLKTLNKTPQALDPVTKLRVEQRLSRVQESYDDVLARCVLF